MPTKPSIVFVHGIWADGSCSERLASRAAGLRIDEADTVGHDGGG